MDIHPRVLVIGATRGTGYQIASRLLQEGYRVRGLARNEAKAKRTLSSRVEVVVGDITKADTLPDAIKDVDHVIFTAGVTQRPAGERLITATEYEGVKNAITAALLNLIKRNTLNWRRFAEDEIRRSGLDYTIVRAGFLTNGPGGRRAIEVSQRVYPLALKYRISRADVAETFVQALKHPQTRRTTFEVVWGRARERKDWNVLFGELIPDG